MRFFLLLGAALISGMGFLADPLWAEGDPGFPAIVASRVLYSMDPAAIAPGGNVREPVVEGMVGAIVRGLTGRKSVSEAWLALANPREDVVGVRVSVSGQRVSGTRLATAMAVVSGLRSAGFPRDRIVVWDRNLEDLLAAGFVRNHPDYQLRWIDAATGYNPDAPVTAPLLGRLIFGDSQFIHPGESRRFADLVPSTQQLSSKSFFSHVLSSEVTKVVHIPSLQDSFLTGLNGAVAGMVIGNIDNWRRFTTPPAFGDPYVSEIYAGEEVAGKIILTLLDGLFLQYAGGPFPAPAHVIENATIFGSFDPVAIDYTARKLLDEAREAHKLPSLEKMTGYLETADAMGLGVTGEERIQLRRVARDGR